MTAIAPAVANYLRHVSSPDPHADNQQPSSNNHGGLLTQANIGQDRQQAPSSLTQPTSHHRVDVWRKQLGNVRQSVREKTAALREKGKGLFAATPSGQVEQPQAEAQSEAPKPQQAASPFSNIPTPRRESLGNLDSSSHNEQSPNMGKMGKNSGKKQGVITDEETEAIRIALISTPPDRVIEKTIKLREEAANYR